MGLFSKWAIIQSIHNEIVDKYQTNQPIYYTQHSICRIINLQNFNVITFSVAGFLILLFMITTKRTSCLRDKCHGYGSLPIPIDFLLHIDRTFATVVFAVISDELIALLERAIFGTSKETGGIVAIYALRIIKVLVMGFRYYPLLVAVHIDSIFTLTCAMVYSWLDYAICIVNQGMCNANFYPTYDDFLNNSTSIIKQLEYYGTGSGLIALELCSNIPKFLCLAYIIVKLPMLLFEKISVIYDQDLSSTKKMIMSLPREQRIFFHISHSDSIEMIYVRNLFRPVDQRASSQVIWARLIPRKIYQWRDDFRFSTRILCIYSSVFLLLYFVAFQAHARGIAELDLIRQKLQALFDTIAILFFPLPGQSSRPGVICYPSSFTVPPVLGPYLFAIYFSLFLIVIQLMVLLVNIRRNLFQAFRGDFTEIPRRKPEEYIRLSDGNIHFAGFFIGYLIWGLILTSALICSIATCIVALIHSKNIRLFEMLVRAVVPIILFILCKQSINRLLAQYLFLQDYGQTFSLNNRRLLMVFIYFNFFFDAFLGFAAAVLRLINAAIAAILYMCRLDYAPLGRKLESNDLGFVAYCGFIHTECLHRHPVMLVFVSHLYTQLKLKQWTIENSDTKLSSRWIRKWKLAVFLMRNPTIVFFRKAFLKQLPIDSHDKWSLHGESMPDTHRF